MKKQTSKSIPSSRQLAALLVHRVVDGGESLGTILNTELAQLDDTRERALTQELVFGTLRSYFYLDEILGKLLTRKLKKRDGDLHALLLIGLYQLFNLRVPAHAAVAETVETARRLGKNWATGLVNGVLRNAQRMQDNERESKHCSEPARWLHPQWWIDRVQQDWPHQWQKILQAGNERPPMTLRINAARISREDYLQRLQATDIHAASTSVGEYVLPLQKPVLVDDLPGFADGLVSVQDGAAQLAAGLLDLKSGQRVLDACAAPGGKTGHIAELIPDLGALVAIDNDASRLTRVADNLQRLQVDAEMIAADASQPDTWWDGSLFDRILLDAPCSASGVLRRHPDIRFLRRASDIANLAVQQKDLLDALWPLLAPGGKLLYVTCSVFKEENSDVTQAFLQQHQEARELVIEAAWGEPLSVGRQSLPGEQDMDGFYFACLLKADS